MYSPSGTGPKREPMISESVFLLAYPISWVSVSVAPKPINERMLAWRDGRPGRHPLAIATRTSMTPAAMICCATRGQKSDVTNARPVAAPKATA